uniref:Venom S1 protease 13 n=1 Tax=Oncocephalus sp. TaxID=2944721 RepID=A0AB38ZEI5_9HEMI
MILKGILLAVFALITTSQCTHYMDAKIDKVITSKDYPDFTKSSDNWFVGHKQLGGAVLVNCSVIFKGNNGNCDNASLIFYDGIIREAICNNKTNYSIHSKFNSIKIELIINRGEALFMCNNTALPYGRPDKEENKTVSGKGDQTVQPGTTGGQTLRPGTGGGQFLQPITGDLMIKENVVYKNISGNLTEDMHYKYRLKCDINRNILLKCQMRIHAVYADPTRRCETYRLRVHSGTKARWQCQTDNYFTHISENEILDVTIDTGKNIKGDVKCEIKSIEKISHSNYKRRASEEIDSSEFGKRNIQGTKKTTCDCGWSNKPIGRIIFGIDAGKYEYPWSVSLQYKHSKFHFCGGSIITPYHILTAAHCISKKAPGDILVVMGSNNRSDSRISSVVKKIYEHNYNRKTFINDIAILELVTKINYALAVGPVCLPTRTLQLDGEFVTAMGWGQLHKSEHGIKDRAIMKKTRLRVIDIESCSIDWNFRWDIKDPKVICTWSKRSDICMGDSGGPVVWHDPEIHRYTLVGLPALCDGCVLRLPSAHTAVHDFYDWIVETIAKSVNPEAQAAQVCTKID